jgi:hypothetical protein
MMDRNQGNPSFCLWAPVVVSLVSVFLLVSLASLDWLRAEGEGGFSEGAIRWGELLRQGPVREPINTFSNLGFIIVGILVGSIAMRDRLRASEVLGMNPLNTGSALCAMFASAAAFLGPGSAAMHASNTEWGGKVDVFSMYLYVTWGLAYALMRLLDLRVRWFWAIYGFLICFSVARIFFDWNPLNASLNELFGACILLSLGGEFLLRAIRRSLTAQWGYLVAAVVAFLIAHRVFWIPNQKGDNFCYPVSSIPGHGIWHILSALAILFTFLYLRSEKPAVSRQGSGRR